MHTIDEIGFSGLDRTNTFRRSLDDKLKTCPKTRRLRIKTRNNVRIAEVLGRTLTRV
ncbi:hypothetical protein LEP1GSC068_3800 [Leptospira sp. Fiocruz LV3954]|uniref:Uncharacterized protein n=1 Tax=Leptospira santarosai serovar Shermani str. LT 821 TaxID=758847 RepID=K8YED8_9LEPT|nr:hypothetical protein LEP1GSC068_3800 [Leptospira sp. Fiocruz LV3954]EKT88652.1 hypothetical protein LSS_01064 [Leptospira santarosai serovar Shermani str. LT 821]EMI62536.1 hypothetical protein LEP1GSC076_3877 [Leptospira sp. Fiocruz LV4135]EPG81986.1 hypothetical protein LEP1GSC048_1561 [Leptospira santarosai serovar Shermani str. 1342KT]